MRAAVLVLTVSLLPMTAKAADMPAAAPSPSASIWTGAYFGVNFGYAFGGSTKQISLLNQRATNFDSINGVIAGGQLGVDYQMSNIVVGLGADYNKSWAANNFEGFEFPGAAKLSHEYVGTFRGRVGYVFGSQVLAYGTAGVAVSNLVVSLTRPIDPIKQIRSLNGYVVGAGIEHKYANNISSFAEYRYTAYAADTLTLYNSRADRKTSEIRVGVNYRF